VHRASTVFVHEIVVCQPSGLGLPPVIVRAKCLQSQSMAPVNLLGDLLSTRTSCRVVDGEEVRISTRVELHRHLDLVRAMGSARGASLSMSMWIYRPMGHKTVLDWSERAQWIPVVRAERRGSEVCVRGAADLGGTLLEIRLPFRQYVTHCKGITPLGSYPWRDTYLSRIKNLLLVGALGIW